MIDKSIQSCQRNRAQRVSPDTTYALAPDVLGVTVRHVHVQVADIGLLGVGLETLSNPEGLGASHEWVADKDESLTTHNGTILD